MKGACNIWLFCVLCLCVVISVVQCHDPLKQLMKARKTRRIVSYAYDEDSLSEYRPVYIQKNQDGLKEADKISSLPGQPPVNFSQYSGYVTVDPDAGRALFYYFTESEDSSSKPLVLWLNGGPGCSSIEGGAMMELGPFRVNPDGETLWLHEYAWNNEANVIFLESPAGVGFSYSNTTSDYKTGDKKTTADSYTFLINWLERFPEYKNRDFYLTGESYAGHYVPLLAKLILQNNKITNQTVINLKGIAIGNALIDDVDYNEGVNDYYWTHALISDEMHLPNGSTWNVGSIYPYDIYAPLCAPSSSSSFPSISTFDPCSEYYIRDYLNRIEVQNALHAFVINGTWEDCSSKLGDWDDWETTLLPTIKGMMASGIASGSIDYITGDTQTVADSYNFVVNWLEIFPEYKTRDFYIAGESYVGHYVPQLADLILRINQITKHTIINLKGIAIGNALIDDEDEWRGHYEYFWMHALISDETYHGIVHNCNYSSGVLSYACTNCLNEADDATSDIYPYNIYASRCSYDNSTPALAFDPCSHDYVNTYLNTPEVQKALHAYVNGSWAQCSDKVRWDDWAPTILPTINELMASGVRVWIYSGDTDVVVPFTSTRYSLSRIGAPVKSPWYPWYVEREVGGYAMEYQNLTFVTVRGSGLFVPSYQPQRALTLFSSFLGGSFLLQQPRFKRRHAKKIH